LRMLILFVTALVITLCMPVEKVAQGWLICPADRVLLMSRQESPHV